MAWRPNGHDAVAATLAASAAFSPCSAAEIAAAADVCEVVRAKAGLPSSAREGDRGARLIVLMDGRAHASHDGEPGRALATGDGIGSSALLEGAPFDLSLVCDTEVATLVLDRHGLERLIDEAPSAARRIIRALSAHAAPRSAPGSRSV